MQVLRQRQGLVQLQAPQQVQMQQVQVAMGVLFSVESVQVVVATLESFVPHWARAPP